MAQGESPPERSEADLAAKLHRGEIDAGVSGEHAKRANPARGRQDPSSADEASGVASADDAEEVLERLLAPGERVVWLAHPDRALWRRLVAAGLGCLPFVALVVAIGLGTAIAGASTVSGAMSGRVEPTRAVAGFLGAVLLAIMLYPIAVDEIARRERRYVVTTRRAFVIVPGRLEAELALADVSACALYSGLFDDWPSG